MLRTLLLVTLAFLTFSAVQARDEIDAKLLLGKWEITGDKLPAGAKATVEFQKDDKLVVEIELQGKQQKVEGKYKVDGNKLEMTMKGPDGQERTHKVTIVKLGEKEATMKDEEKNEEQVLKKVS